MVGVAPLRGTVLKQRVGVGVGAFVPGVRIVGGTDCEARWSSVKDGAQMVRWEGGRVVVTAVAGAGGSGGEGSCAS